MKQQLAETPTLNALHTIGIGTDSWNPARVSVPALRTLIRKRDATYWLKAGERKALKLFQAAATRVPAYKDFLKKHKIQARKIETIKDFRTLPILTKENYIKPYSVRERSWDGKIENHSILAMSSGTSGVPTLWPRGYQQEAEAAFIHEFLFTDLYEVDTYKTLIVICFPMGVYVSGIATAVPTILTAFKHSKISVVTAGNNKDSTLLFLQHTSDDYEQIVLVGHPFFIKDVIETGVEEKMHWTRMRVRTMFCSEGFSEAWRSYVASLLHTEAKTSVLGTYGSSEFLLTGFENPSTIGVRMAAEKDTILRERLFGGTVVPSLFQFNPLSRFIESVGGDLVVTASSGVPLIRYNQHDMGTVLPFSRVHDVLKSDQYFHKAWQWPFVTLFGRSDRTLVLYAANIYPEHIQLTLSTAKYAAVFTGKFFMEKKELPRMEQKLVIHIELRSGVKTSKGFEVRIRDHVVRELKNINIEYRDASTMLGGEKMVPIIILHQHGDPSYFKSGLKPRFMAPR